MINSVVDQFDQKLSNINRCAQETNERFSKALKDKEGDIEQVHAELLALKKKVMKTDADHRKKSFIIRNYPEGKPNGNGSFVSNCSGAVNSIATVL